MWNDLCYALRTLRRAPGFALIAIVTLALGIGANTAIFSLLYQVVLRTVPVAHPESLVSLRSDDYQFGWSRSDNNHSIYSFPMYRELRDRNEVFAGLIARAGFPATITARSEASRTYSEVVTGNYFQVLGVRPALGRLLLPSDDSANAETPAIALSYAYWAGHFGSDPKVLNSRVLMNSHPVLVVGVAQPNFRGLVSGNTPDFFVPVSAMKLVSPGWDKDDVPDAYWLNIFGRLKPGVTEAQASANLLPIFRAVLNDQVPRFHDLSDSSRKKVLAKTIQAESAAQGLNQLRDQWQRPLFVLMVMVGLVLLIACANVANLLIARAASRQREIAVRLAIGATRMQILRQLLVESVILSLAGGLLGVAAAGFFVQGLLSLLPTDATGGWLSSDLDVRLLAFSFGLSLLFGIVFGLVPALQAAQPELASTLKEQSLTASGAGAQSRTRQVLVAAQICLSLLLLVGAGLFTRSLANLLYNDPGFRADHLITFSISPALTGYSHERCLVLYRRLAERLKSLPGVGLAAQAELSPFGGWNWGSGIKLNGSRKTQEEFKDVRENSIDANYFRTLGIPLVAGREFRQTDSKGAPKVAILNETLARFLFEHENPIGRHIQVGPHEDATEVVGVVKDSKYSDLREKPTEFLYVPYEQGEGEFLDQAAFFVRTKGDEASAMSGIRAAVKELDANIPVERLRSMRVLLDDSVYTDRLIAMLAMGFGVLATVLAAVGLYGTISFAVAQRTREFGIRLALGAERQSILSLVFREIGALVAVGGIVGLVASYGLARLVESQLFGIRANDPVVLLVALGVIVTAATMAGLVPAVRAMRIEPVRALRYE